MSWRDALLALAVAAVWGSNFVVIRWGLEDFPPLLFAALRFALAFLPAALFLKRPAVPWRNLAAWGLAIGVGQFGLLFIAIDGRIAPGLASLVVQTQVFFTIGLAMRLTGERVAPLQWAALGLGAAGLAIIGAFGGGEATPLGLALVLGAALGWALGNTVQRATPGVSSLAYVVWASGFAVLPLAALSLIFEGPVAIGAALAGAGALGWTALAWQAAGNSLFGYAAWGWLLARYPAATVAPTALLIPVFGLGSAALLLGEPLPPWKLGAAALIVGGLALNMVAARRVRPPSAA